MDLSKFGVTNEQVSKLDTAGVKYPSAIKNRVAHIDADFMAYMVSAESKAELDPDDPTPRKTFDDMLHNAYVAVDHIRRMAQAERAVLHVTHNSDKGGRGESAIIKPYQANRLDRDKPEHLDEIRVYLGSGVNDTTGVFVGAMHTHQEADDGMCQAAIADPENAVVCSKDKDLLMVPGLHMDMDTYEVWTAERFGSIWIDDTKSSKKVKGHGTKFFWAQMLMGDTADNISGLPACPGAIWQYYSGTKAYRDVLDQWVASNDPVVSRKLEDKMSKLEAKTKLCGPMLTFQLLDGCKTDAECYNLVKRCFVELETKHGYEYKHWNTGKRVTPTQAMLSEMLLLWMRRTPEKMDVLNWIKGGFK